MPTICRLVTQPQGHSEGIRSSYGVRNIKGCFQLPGTNHIAKSSTCKRSCLTCKELLQTTEKDAPISGFDTGRVLRDPFQPNTHVEQMRAFCDLRGIHIGE